MIYESVKLQQSYICIQIPEKERLPAFPMIMYIVQVSYCVYYDQGLVLAIHTRDSRWNNNDIKILQRNFHQSFFAKTLPINSDVKMKLTQTDNVRSATSCPSYPAGYIGGRLEGVPCLLIVHEAWYWLKCIPSSGWPCITFFFQGNVVHWLFLHC